MVDDPLNRLKARRGSQLSHARLNEEKVAEILRIFAQREKLKQQLRGMTNSEIAKKYGVHYRTIDRISAGESWGHVQ